MLLIGEIGTGKTFIARTARKPVHIDSFDYGGATGLREWEQKGEIIINDYEDENPFNPQQFSRWKTEFETLRSGGYFDHIGTYMLDSSTSFEKAIMGLVMQQGGGLTKAKGGRAGQVPEFTSDFYPTSVIATNWIKLVCTLPCDVIVTGHLAPKIRKQKNDLGEIVEYTDGYQYSAIGKAKDTIPLCFDEVYHTDVKEGSKGLEYYVITQRTDKHVARSRLAGEGKLQLRERPDIKHILKAAGLPTDDKPLLL